MSLPPLVYAAAIALVLPSVIGIFQYRRLPPDLKPLTVLFGIHALITIAQFVLAFQRINNIWTSHAYYLIEVVILFWIYSLWTPSGRARSIFLVLSILYGVFWIVGKFSFEDFTIAALYTPSVSRIILLGSTLYILGVIAVVSEHPLHLEPKFWFAAGFLTIFSGSLMFYGFRTIMLNFSSDSINALWSIHWSITILSNFLHVIGFLCILRRPNIGGQLELAP